jgi:hypothetical protein
MVHDRPRLLVPTFVATCALASMLAACNATTPTSTPADDGGPNASMAEAGSRADSSSDTGPGAEGDADARGPDADLGADVRSPDAEGGAADAHGPDAASNQGRDGGSPMPVASCQTGDRTEWSGPIANTGIGVAVCSVCGASYVVAANGSTNAGQVSVANGSQTLTVDVPAGGTATSGNLADNPSDGTVTVCATAPSHACLPSAPENQRYCDPYRDVTSLTSKRIDQGVDYGGSGPIYAMGPGIIDQYLNRNDAGWPGHTFVSYRLSAGPAAGRIIYLAENIDLDPSLQSGSFVYNGTALGTMVNASPYSESGWGVAGEHVTAEYGCYVEGCMTPLGVNFNALLVCLNTPSGVPGQQTDCCSPPTGWPTDWCTELAGWQ